MHFDWDLVFCLFTCIGEMSSRFSVQEFENLTLPRLWKYLKYLKDKSEKDKSENKSSFDDKYDFSNGLSMADAFKLAQQQVKNNGT